MAKMSVQELHNEIAHALGKLSDLFVPGMKLSFMARLPGNGEADVLVGDDNNPEEMIALINRRFGTPSSAPTAGSIDSDELTDLLELWADARPGPEAYAAYKAIIAHIDTWAGRSARPEQSIDLAHCVLEWNRAQAQPPIAIGKEYFVAQQIEQMLEARSAGNAAPAPELPPIDYDKAMDRTYIPLPGGWEIQTKGKGSTFRIAHIGSRTRWMVLDDNLHEPLEALARDMRNAIYGAAPAPGNTEKPLAYIPSHVMESLRAGCQVATVLSPTPDEKATEALYG